MTTRVEELPESDPLFLAAWQKVVTQQPKPRYERAVQRWVRAFWSWVYRPK